MWWCKKTVVFFLLLISPSKSPKLPWYCPQTPIYTNNVEGPLERPVQTRPLYYTLSGFPYPEMWKWPMKLWIPTYAKLGKGSIVSWWALLVPLLTQTVAAPEGPVVTGSHQDPEPVPTDATSVPSERWGWSSPQSQTHTHKRTETHARHQTPNTKHKTQGTSEGGKEK